MSQPFRDEYAAALDRAEQLAAENEDLRAEVARIRVERVADGAAAAAPPPPAPPPPPPDSLKRETLERLDALSHDLDAHPAPIEPKADAALDEAFAAIGHPKPADEPRIRIGPPPPAPQIVVPWMGPPSLTEKMPDARAAWTEMQAKLAKLEADNARLRIRLVLAIALGIIATIVVAAVLWP